MPTSQNGWPAATAYTGHGIPLSNLRWVTGSVRSGDVLFLFNALGAWYNRFVEPIDVKRSWGFAPREIRGNSTTLSNHASGTAVDFNSNKHPLGAVGTFSSSQRAHILAKMDEWGGVVRWGGTYSGRKDEMHFEINTNSATVALLVRQIKEATLGNQKALAKIGYYDGELDGAPGPVYSDALYRFQATMPGVDPDGVWGNATNAAYKEAERKVTTASKPVEKPEPELERRAVAITAVREPDIIFARMLGQAHGFAYVEPKGQAWVQVYPNGKEVDVDVVDYLVAIGYGAEELVSRVGEGLAIAGGNRHETSELVIERIRETPESRTHPWA